MVRSIFFSLGLFVALWGGSLLLVDKLVLNAESDPQSPAGFRGLFGGVSQSKKKVIDPPDWAAFSLMSLGTVTMLYAVALPKKKAESFCRGGGFQPATIGVQASGYPGRVSLSTFSLAAAAARGRFPPFAPVHTSCAAKRFVPRIASDHARCRCRSGRRRRWHDLESCLASGTLKAGWKPAPPLVS